MIDLKKIEKAFDALNRRANTEHGGIIITETNFFCCQNCACTELVNRIAVHNAVQKATGDSLPIVGYVFYHQQDTEDCQRGYDLHLSYAGAEEWPDDSDNLPCVVRTKQIANMLIECLKQEGLTVEWNGSVQTRVCVKAPNHSNPTSVN